MISYEIHHPCSIFPFVWSANNIQLIKKDVLHISCDIAIYTLFLCLMTFSAVANVSLSHNVQGACFKGQAALRAQQILPKKQKPSGISYSLGECF